MAPYLAKVVLTMQQSTADSSLTTIAALAASAGTGDLFGTSENLTRPRWRLTASPARQQRQPVLLSRL